MEKNPLHITNDVFFTMKAGMEQHLGNSAIRAIASMGGVIAPLINDSNLSTAGSIAGATLGTIELVRSYRDGRKERTKSTDQSKD